MPIRNRRSDTFQPTPLEPSPRLVDYRELEFNFGSNDSAVFRLDPAGCLNTTADEFEITLAPADVVRIDRHLVRWWRDRTIKAVVLADSYRPDDM